MILITTQNELRKFMAALDNLTLAITNLTTAVASIPQAGAPPTGGATEVQVQTAADQVNAQSAIITAKLTPAVTPPTGT